MYSINVFVAPNTQPLVLLYKNEETWKAAYDKLHSFDSMGLGGAARASWGKIEDDYGQHLDLQAAPLAILRQDMALAREADIERHIFNQLTQIKTQERMKMTPTIANAMRQQSQGPAVMSPFAGMPRQ